jgi:SpoVK/Ycf46/Vps4 family AAA+-type ATPase
MNEVTLHETVHPDRAVRSLFNNLVGIDSLKEALLEELAARLGSDRLASWQRRHHPCGLPLAERSQSSSPLVLLSGDVGCGKTALANAVGTPLAEMLDRRVVTMETPSDLRGWGHVGEMSARITDAFDQARRRARDIGGGLLVIDEADDVATSRAQMQAHHEDRAGLNVLIKQIDQLARSKDPLVVILITNRDGALDPAVRRRTSLHLSLARPELEARRAVFDRLLEGVRFSTDDLRLLANESQRAIPYSYSDLVERLGRAILREAQRRDCPVTLDLVRDCLSKLEPSPLVDSGR